MGLRTLFAPTLAVALLVPMAALPVAADDVHLSNGETFDGVIAEVQGDQVEIHLPHGVIRMPMSRVVRIDRATSAYEEYLKRADALHSQSGPSARSGSLAETWLDLALWARDRDLPSCVRDAALEAARLDPDLDGLAPLLRDLGYARDDELGGWVPYEDLMARKGYVQVDGRWIPADVVAAAARQAREESERQAAARRDAQVDRAITLLALAQAQQTQQAEESRREQANGLPASVLYPYGTALGSTVAVFPGRVSPRPRAPHGGHHGAPEAAPSETPAPAHNVGTWSDVAKRQPGSIIPLQASTSASSHPRH